MQAAIMGAPFDITIGDWRTPQPGPGEVLVSVAAAGICAGDMYFYLGKNLYAVYPQICGHEIAGVVAALGEGVTCFINPRGTPLRQRVNLHQFIREKLGVVRLGAERLIAVALDDGTQGAMTSGSGLGGGIYRVTNMAQAVTHMHRLIAGGWS